MNKNWSQHCITPGSVKSVYGAQYPPLRQAPVDPCSSNQNAKIEQSKNKPEGVAQLPVNNNFQVYEASVSDAWAVEDVKLDNEAVNLSANVVLERHAQKRREYSNDDVMPNVSTVPSRNSRRLAMQRLATQKDREKDFARFDRLRHVLFGKSTENDARSPFEIDVDLEQLQKDCWMGIPQKLRPNAWRLLSGYVPANADRREVTLTRKRGEYWHYVEQYFHTRCEEQHQDTFRQIHIDIPRMCPLIPLFQQKLVQEIFERVLYIWAIRHPASGYVQGINDLVTPFFVVFLSEFVQADTEVGTFDVSQLESGQLSIIEADSFWCVSALLDTIQDNYTFAQPGIQRKVLQLRHLVSRVDNQLHIHLESHNVEYLQFAFRWMNNILMREIPLRATIRLWDTYLSEINGFSQFHDYVCAAFLRMWSKPLQLERDFQSIMLLLQNLPTHKWADQQICELTADAFSLMALFAGAKNHLQSSLIT